MSKAQSPTPGPSPVGRGAVCLAACFLGCLSLISRFLAACPLVHYIYNKVYLILCSAFCGIVRKSSFLLTFYR